MGWADRKYKYTIDEEIKELKRENKQRERVYGKLIEQGRMKKEDANRQIMIVRQIIKRLERIRQSQAGEQTELI